MDAAVRRGYASLRKGRRSILNQVYLITAVTSAREPVFADWRLGRVLVHALRRHQHVADTLCYVSMPDHMHWLMRLRTPIALAQVVGGVKGLSSRNIRRFTGKLGPVWQTGFHDRALRSEETLLPTARYILAAPLRAGLVKRLGDYPLWDAIWLEPTAGSLGSRPEVKRRPPMRPSRG